MKADITRETIKAQGSIYAKDCKERDISIKYSLPQLSNESIGLFVIVPGYGAELESNVFRHMMEDFPSLYNVAVLQVDYFGFKYMNNKVNEELIEIMANPYILKGDIFLDNICAESLEDFNDMGVMQAMDIITATLYLQNKYECIDDSRVILFGVSHGAYISYLANALCPFAFSHLIDISSYVTPYYFTNYRKLAFNENHKKFIIIFDYLIQHDLKLRYHNSLYNLQELYQLFDNKCYIISFQGTNDWMVDYQEKSDFINSVPNAELITVTESDVDGVIFGNSDHGLGANYIKLMETIFLLLDDDKNTVMEKKRCDRINLSNLICISYDGEYPQIEEIIFPN